MSLQIGIVGLPNVGKSTLFKALTKQQVDIANYPFCTISPNVGVVKVPDERLVKLAEMSKSVQIVPTAIEFVDIAGLVKGASQGEGLGNQFLSHIREVDAIAQVVRSFNNDNIIHVDGTPDPIRDRETINFELIFSDASVVEKRLATAKTRAKAGQDAKATQLIDVLERINNALQKGQMAKEVSLNPDEYLLVRDLNLLTLKPMMYIVNSDEGDTKTPAEWEELLKGECVSLSVQHEADMAELSVEELTELGLVSTGLEKVILAAYKLLKLNTFLTTGIKETRAWTIRNGAKAPEAAGVIHSDFEKTFIRADVINWQDLLNCGSEVAAKEKGLIRSEGKEYVMRDGDTVEFHCAA